MVVQARIQSARRLLQIEKLQVCTIEQSIEEYDFEDDTDMTVSLEYKEDYEKINSLVNQLEAHSQQIVRLNCSGNTRCKKLHPSRQFRCQR